MRAAGAHGTAEGGAAAASSGDISGPEERLAFALSDGRVGVLAVKGRKVCGRQTSSGPLLHVMCSEACDTISVLVTPAFCILCLWLPRVPVHTPYSAPPQQHSERGPRTHVHDSPGFVWRPA